MDTKSQKQIDDIMYETNEKISAIVTEFRDVKFSKLNESEKQVKCDYLRDEFEKVMLEEEKKVEQVMKNANEN